MYRMWLTVLFALLLASLAASAEEWELVKLTDNSVDELIYGGSITADGKKIVFVSDTDGNIVTSWDKEVFLMDLETKQIERITNNVYEDAFPTISGDGSKIAFVEYKSGGRLVYVVREENGWQQTTPLFEALGWVVPLLNHDGSVLTVYNLGFFEIKYIYTATGAQHKASSVFLDPTLYSYYLPTKSSGGYKHSFVDSICYDCVKHVYLSNLAPSQPAEIYTASEDEHILHPPSASDDGKVVFLMESESLGGRNGIFIYQNGNLMQLVNEEEVYPAISGDGSKVYYIKYSYNNGWEIFAVNPDGSGEEKIISTGLKRMSAPFVNYDGSILVFRGEDADGDLELYAVMKKNQVVVGSFNLNFVPAFPAMTTITVGSAQASYGDEVQIPVEIEKASKIGSMNLIIAYPKDVLEVVDVIQGSLTKNSLFDYNVEDGKIKIGVSDTNGISGDGSLFYMKFRVMEAKEKESGEKPGKQRIGSENLLRLKEISDVYSISVEGADVYDVDGSQMKPLVINGTFEIVSEEDMLIKGDVNGDGKINSLDALLALQMSIGKIDAKAVADMDGDGKVLAKDATEIMRIAAENIVEMTRKLVEQGVKLQVR